MKTSLFIVLALVAIVAVVILWRRRRSEIVGLDHVFAFVGRIDGLKTAAIDRFDTPLRMPGDARAAVTRAGLAMVYTISADGDRYRHRLRINQLGARPNRAIGGRFLVLGVKRLQVPGMEVGLGVTDDGGYHAEWVLDDEQQAVFVDQVPESLDQETLGTVFAACLDEVERVQFEAVVSGP